MCYHFNINNLNDKERKEFSNRQKTFFFFFFEKLKARLERKKIFEPKIVAKLKMEISSLISLAKA